MLILQSRERRSVLITTAIVGTFVLCWSPAWTLYLAMSLSPWLASRVDFRAVTLVWWLAYANSACNPVIYTVFSGDFGDAFRRMFLRRGGRRGERNEFGMAAAPSAAAAAAATVSVQ